MDELKDARAQHHLTLRCGDILAELEARAVDHRDPAVLHVVHQVLQATEEVVTTRLNRLLDDDGVQEGRVRRADAVEVLAQVKVSLAAFSRGERVVLVELV